MSKVDVKVVLLGSASVGKTSLIERYIQRTFRGDNATTIGAAFQAKRVTIDGKTLTLGIWDTAGSERFESMSKLYYRSARAALICFDASTVGTFEKVKFWVSELKANEPECQIFIVACKVDQEVRVDLGTARNFSEKVAGGGRFFETSARTGRNVDELFYSVAEEYVQSYATFGDDDVGTGRGTVDIKPSNSMNEGYRDGGGGGGCQC